MHIIICDRTCENWASRHKLHPVTLKVISEYWNRVFLFCNLHNEFLIIAENFIAIVCWDKEIWIEKIMYQHALFSHVQSHITYTACTLANQILVVDNIWTLFMQNKQTYVYLRRYKKVSSAHIELVLCSSIMLGH